MRNSYLKSINYIKKKTYIDEWHIKMLYNEYKKKKSKKVYYIIYHTTRNIYNIYVYILLKSMSSNSYIREIDIQKFDAIKLIKILNSYQLIIIFI